VGKSFQPPEVVPAAELLEQFRRPYPWPRLFVCQNEVDYSGFTVAHA